MMGVKRIRFGLLGAVVAAACVTTTVSTASAADVGGASLSARKGLYAAISVNVANSALGWSVNATTRKVATDTAQAMCRKSKHADQCHNIAWVRSGCVAVAFQYKGKAVISYSGGYGKNAAAANTMAVKKAGAGSKVKLTKCVG